MAQLALKASLSPLSIKQDYNRYEHFFIVLIITATRDEIMFNQQKF